MKIVSNNICKYIAYLTLVSLTLFASQLKAQTWKIGERDSMKILLRDSLFYQYKSEFLLKNKDANITPEEMDEILFVDIIKSAWSSNVFKDQGEVIENIIGYLQMQLYNNRLNMDTIKLKIMFGDGFQVYQSRKFFTCRYWCKQLQINCSMKLIDFVFDKSTGLLENITYQYFGD